MDSRFRRRHLPHWDKADATYFITTCLADSIPALALREIRRYRTALDTRRRPEEITEEDWEHRKNKMAFAKLDEILDGRSSTAHLARPELAEIVEGSIRYFEAIRYRTVAYVVMPSHLHWVFHPLPEWYEKLPPGRSPREIIMHSLKSFTGSACNEILKRSGPFWWEESFDHWIRNDDELIRVVEYVENNPVKAGLVRIATEYRFSSAYARQIIQS